MYDAIIIGAGPAGVSCAMWLKQLGFNPLVLEKNATAGGLQLQNPYDNTFIATSPPTPGSDVAQTMQDNLRHHRIEALFNITAKSATKVETGDTSTYRVEASNGAVYEGKTLVLATGVRHKTLGLASRANLILGSGHVIASRDFTGANVAILGGGDSAFENYRFVLERGAASATIFARNIRASVEQLRHVPPEHVVLGHCVFDSDTNQVNGEIYSHVLVLYGYEAPVEALLGLPLLMKTSGFVQTDATTMTSISGVYAIGEIAQAMHPCTVTAMAEGIVAAKAIQTRLSQDTVAKYKSLTKRVIGLAEKIMSRE